MILVLPSQEQSPRRKERLSPPSRGHGSQAGQRREGPKQMPLPCPLSCSLLFLFETLLNNKCKIRFGYKKLDVHSSSGLCFIKGDLAQKGRELPFISRAQWCKAKVTHKSLEISEQRHSKYRLTCKMRGFGQMAPHVTAGDFNTSSSAVDRLTKYL